ncbi:PREDICTED: uncharacterized protein LOC104799481 isoform X2 [Tarenaya hassleriana]|uniref:uncharacterized protein LOC104799481 isoform X2 n=1 Tax=Tarenaya hassleriana TaxID=28532 RepID=UPI00053C0A56|nr:PREDICTED: uncharacterized protein LOC104799481 isoform X2 [Tarenaya hassleriana]
MSDQGEKTCPLCAEEMDQTDQQLKPCRCGYQICVWCWHHIMDMAEKDESEGRCPACRTPYDKEKIVGMTVNCERLASEANMERKKTQKSKSKPSEGRKQLTSVRVIQRNLVYIVGLPLNLADEDLLQSKEYFGQYGKVLKVSMSRMASGVIQQFPNNTCSVYITYSKEEEAVRCIQSVHGFILDGKSLKACFGTTKYCHAWLRNVPCNNPDCLYLHEIGCQEDSFTKDEFVSAHTRVQQITGATNNLMRRLGSVLPPPVDDYCSNSSTAKPIVQVPSNTISNVASIPKSSPPNGSSGRSTALPAAASWGTRILNQQSAATSIASDGYSDTSNGTLASSAHEPISCSDNLKKPSHEEENQTVVEKNKPGLLKPLPHNIVVDFGSRRANLPDGDPTSNQISCSVESSYDSRVMNEPSAVVNSLDYAKEIADDGLSINNLSTDVARMGITTDSRNDHPGSQAVIDIHSDQGSIRQPGNEVSKLPHGEECRKDSPMNTDEKAFSSYNEKSVVRPEWNWMAGLRSQMQVSSKSEVDDVRTFDNGRQKVGEVVSPSTSSVQGPNRLPFCASPFGEVSGVLTSNADAFLESRGSNRSLLPNGLTEGSISTVEHSLFGNEAEKKIQNAEDDIISSILSLDFDPWDESVTSSRNLVTLLGEGDQRVSSHRPSNILKPQHNSQSRFYFARQDESNLLNPQHYNQAFENQTYGIHGQLPRDQPALLETGVTGDIYQDKRNGYASNYSEVPENFPPAHPVYSSYKIPAASRSQISAPPGFSALSRSPPPGFSSHERMEHSYDTVAAGTPRLLDSTTLLRQTYQAPHPGGNSSLARDLEFMDPAILAVGRGRHQNGLGSAEVDMRYSFPSQLNSFESNSRLEMLMQRSLSAQQQSHDEYRDLRDVNNFSSQLNNDPYGIIGSRLIMDQTQGTSLSRQPFPNSLLHGNSGQWDRWNNNEASSGGNSLGMAEIQRRNIERLGFGSKSLYNGFEESKFRMASSGDHLYSRT